MRERDQEGFAAALLRETEQSGPPCQAVNKTCVAAKENEWRVTEGVVSHMQQSSRKSAAAAAAERSRVVDMATA